jgi:hypothetical protein
VDGDELDQWVETFHAMAADGERVTLPIRHTAGADPEANRGFVHDLFREGDSLFGIIEAIGDDALKAVSRSDVSIYAEPEFKSGNGKTYPWAIQHVALTTKPVIPGLAGFEAIAASRDGKSHTLTLSLPSEGASTMPDVTPEVAATTVTDEVDPVVSLKKSFKAQAAKLWDDDKLDASGIATAMKDLRKRMLDVLTKLEGMQPKEEPASEAGAVATIAASRDSINPIMIEQAATIRQMKLDAEVAAGRLTPAASAKLKAAFIGENNKAVALSLSRGVSDGFDDALDACKAQGPAVSLGEKTGQQTLDLSNSLVGKTGENPLLADADMRAARAAKKWTNTTMRG